MATLPGLQKAKVRDAVLQWNDVHDKNPVPDFTTRKKTCCIWSKIYVSIANNEVQFIELNPCLRFLWCLLGWYKETIIEPATLQKVTDFIHEFYTSPDAQDIAALQIQKRTAQTKHDYIHLKKTLEAGLAKFPTAATELQKDIRTDLEDLLADVNARLASKVLEEFKDDYLSSKFLKNVLKLAEENNPQNQLVWSTIEEALKLNPDAKKAELNVQLFRTLVSVLSGDPAADVIKGGAEKPKEKVDLISCSKVRNRGIVVRRAPVQHRSTDLCF